MSDPDQSGFGRIALVTGASRGLGSAVAVELAAAGNWVAVNYFQNQEAAARVCAAIRAAGGVAQAFQADVRDEGEVERLVREVEAAFGEVEILVANATGVQPFFAIEEQTWDVYLDQLEFFVKSPLLLLKRVVGGMKRRRFGRVIQIGSEVVDLGNARFANYIAAKAAQLGQTRSWAVELAATGITMNLVAPGWIPTERHADASAGEIAAYTAGVPMGRMGTPEDVAKLVTFLASDGARFITGQKFAVNGANTLA